LTNLPTELLAKVSNASVTCSFVVSEQGEVITASGDSKGLGNATDLELLRTLRANSEVVLTSGLTARLERYRMPRHADLAIFTKRGVSNLDLKPKAGQRLQLLTPPLVTSYLGALRALQTRYESIHVEFGPTGALAIKDHVDLFVVSSVHEHGAAAFLRAIDLQQSTSFIAKNLFITTAIGRG
jgi:hypothetical protein